MRDRCSSPLSVRASPLIYGNVWSRWSIIVRWTLTIKISQVLVAGGARGRPGSNHYRFTLLMMGRELIYPGEKQIKALLSPVLCHTIAYINILSWAIQVSKGLVHLHFHKGPLSTPWPPFPSWLSSWWVPAVLSFTSRSSSFHFPLRPLNLPPVSFSPMYVTSPLAPSSSWAPAVSCPHSSTSTSCWIQKNIQIFVLKTNLHDSDVLIPSDTDVSLVDRQCRLHREKQDSADTVENVTVIYGPVYKSSLGLHCIIETTYFSYLKWSTDPVGCFGSQ